MVSRTHRARRPLLLVASLVALVASLAVASVASAAILTGGTTTLEVKKGTAKKLKKQGVKIKPAAGATKSGNTYSFAIVGGTLDRGDQYTQPASPSGAVRHDAGLKFKCKGGKVKVTELLATFAAKSDLSGISKGSTLKLADLNTSGAVVADDGLDVANAKAKFAKKFRKRLDKACGVDVKRRTLGTVHVDGAANLQVFSGETRVTLATDFAIKLGGLKEVDVTPIAPATLTPGPGPGGLPPTLAFPITGGELNPTTFTGQITHSGGFGLHENPADLPPHDSEVTDLILDLTGPSGGSISAFSSTISSRASLFGVAITGTPSVSGSSLNASADVTLTAGAAGLLNDLFNDPGEPGGEFAAGEPVGTGTIAAAIG